MCPYVIAVVSGKGGSGKTTLSVELAKYMSKKGHKVALMDLDVRGPNLVSKIESGLKWESSVSVTGKLSALRVNENLSAFSLEGYTDEETGIALDSNSIKLFIQSLFITMDWGFEPDVYICDMDPAPGETLEALKEMFGKKVYVLLVSTPDQLSVSNTIRSLNVCLDKNISVKGYVGNMVGLECPICGKQISHCGSPIHLYGAPENLDVFNTKYNLEHLGDIAFNSNFNNSPTLKRTVENIYKKFVPFFTRAIKEMFS